MLHNLDSDIYYPCLVGIYVKIETAGNSSVTKFQIMKSIFDIAGREFNVAGKTLDSWYSARDMMDESYVTELRKNGEISLEYMGRMTPKKGIYSSHWMR